METRRYSCAIIGSSPICLIEAAYQSKFSGEVLIIESDKSLGGAWKTISLFNATGAEIGPHLIYSSCDNRDVYRFLSNLGILMKPLLPEPFCMLSGSFLGVKKIAIRHRWLPIASEFFDKLSEKKTSSSIELAHRIRRFTFAIIKQLRGFYTRPLYPEHGSAELISKLTALLDANRVEVMLNTKVLSLEINRTTQTAILRTNSSVLTAKKVIITSHLSLSAIFEHGGPLADLDFHREELTVVHLLVRDAQPPTFSYVRFHDNKSLVRISDITNYVRFDSQTNDLRVICVHIRRCSRSDDECIESTFDFLKIHDLISKNALVVDYHIVDYLDAFLTENTMRTLNEKYAPIIETLRTDDNFSYGLSANLERWRNGLLDH